MKTPHSTLKNGLFLTLSLLTLDCTTAVSAFANPDPTPTPAPFNRRIERRRANTNPTALDEFGKYIFQNLLTTFGVGYEGLKQQLEDTKGNKELDAGELAIMGKTAGTKRGYLQIGGAIMQFGEYDYKEGSLFAEVLPYTLKVNADGSLNIKVAAIALENFDPETFVRSNDDVKGLDAYFDRLRVLEFNVEKVGGVVDVFNLSIVDFSVKLPLVTSADIGTPERTVNVLSLYMDGGWDAVRKYSYTNPTDEKTYSESAFDGGRFWIGSGAKLTLPLSENIMFGLHAGYSVMGATTYSKSERDNLTSGLRGMKAGMNFTMRNKNGTRYELFYKGNFMKAHSLNITTLPQEPIIQHQIGFKLSLRRKQSN